MDLVDQISKVLIDDVFWDQGLDNLLKFSIFLFIASVIYSWIESSKNKKIDKIKVLLLAYINSKFIFSLVHNWFELLKWLTITGVITFAAEKSEDKILLIFMYITYFALFIYLIATALKHLYPFTNPFRNFLHEFNSFLISWEHYRIWLKHYEKSNKAAQELFLDQFEKDPKLLYYRKYSLRIMLKLFFFELLLVIFVLYFSGIGVVGIYKLVHDTVLKIGILSP